MQFMHVHSGRWRVVCAAVFALATTGSALAQTPARKGTVERVKVHSPALVGNLSGESPERDVFVYLPPGYATNRNQRYPVVYMLHGYGLTAERWMPFSNIAAAADQAIAAGTMKEMIVVSPDGYTQHGGSMYSSSATIGDWETYIAEDLVAYVDSRYRTLAARESRGLGGHSMGGYGTLRIGMKRPDVFSSLYPMSSCCVIDATVASGGRGRAAGPGPGARGGRGSQQTGAAAGPAAAPGATTPGAATPGATAPGAVAGQAASPAAAAVPAATPAPSAAAAPGQGRGDGGARGAAAQGRGGFGNVQYRLAAAWAPNPKKPPLYFDLPVVDGEPQPLVIARYAANSPFAMLPQYVTNLKKYKAIKLDCGLQDGLLGQNRQLVESMEALGVPHVFETYEGNHSDKVPQRIEQNVLPFFSGALSFTAPKRK